jgi:hypothetical protein
MVLTVSFVLSLVTGLSWGIIRLTPQEQNVVNEPASDLSEDGAPVELLEIIERTIMGFRLEDFDRHELRRCALAVLEECRSFRPQ